MTAQNAKLIMAASELVELLKKSAGCDMRMKTLQNEGKVVIHASERSFPLTVLNRGDISAPHWSGEPKVVRRIQEIEELENICIEMQARQVGDETFYNDRINQDVKLVITIKNK